MAKEKMAKSRHFPHANLFFNICLAFFLFIQPAHSSQIEKKNFQLSPQGHILVEVKVNGRGTFIFALDTGASKTVVSPTSGLFSAQDDGNKGASVQGPIKKRKAQPGMLKFLSIGKITQENMKVNIMSLSHISRDEFVLDGILGQDFLDQYDLEFDFPNRVMKFYTKASSLNSCDICQFEGTKIPFENDFGGLIKLSFTINELDLVGILDTGSGLTTVNKQTIFSLGMDMRTLRANDPNSPNNTRRINISKITKILEEENQKGQRQRGERVVRPKRSNDDELKPFQAHQMKEYRIPVSSISYKGNILNKHQSIAYIDLPIFRHLGFRTKPAALIGTDIFQNKTLRISNGMKILNISNSELILLDP